LSALDLQRDGAVARIILNRPDKRNAIDDATRDALTKALADYAANPEIRVVVLTGNGTVFCAGVDLSSSTGTPPDPNRPRLVDPFDRFTKPIIAAINGPAIGGGLEIALACDLRIASTTARFSLPEVKIGSLPGSGGTQRLPIAVGSALAAQMIFTGEPVLAERALAAGLVSELCEPGKLLERANQLAQAIARNAPLSLMAAKRVLRSAIESSLIAGYELERSLFNQLAQTEDRQEGRAAFRERRPPNFKGR
jgi:enoyl-CoA hydratase/carnithine racemase